MIMTLAASTLGWLPIFRRHLSKAGYPTMDENLSSNESKARNSKS